MIPLAFAPFHLFPLAVFGLAWLFWLWRHTSPRQAFRLGWWFGLGMFGLGVSWVEVSIARYGGVGEGFAWFLTASFVAILALYPAFLGYIVQSLYPREGKVKGWLVLPAAWVLMEWLRGWLFSGFPWLALGYSQIDAPLGGMAPLLGVYGISWLTALTAGFLLTCIAERRPALALLPFLLWLGAWPLGTLQWTTPKGESIPVALIQGNIEQGIKWAPEALPSTLERYLAFTHEALGKGNRLIVWPETALPLFYHQARDFLDRLGEDARRRGASLLIGLPFRAGDRYYNSLVGLGERTVFYHKRHLVPFGEYIPLKGIIGDALALLSIPMSDFSPGPPHQPPPLSLSHTCP
ncbi:MAG: apolipoprotein N-acyltransferase, partial [Gammaproteobacteria bacterium]